LDGPRQRFAKIAAFLKVVPPMRHWTVEGFMARVNKFEGIDMGWRNYLREPYDV